MFKLVIFRYSIGIYDALFNRIQWLEIRFSNFLTVSRLLVWVIQLSSINRDSIYGENCLKFTNEMIIFPYVTIIDSSINRENLRKSQNKIFPINGTQLFISVLKILRDFMLNYWNKINILMSHHVYFLAFRITRVFVTLDKLQF